MLVRRRHVRIEIEHKTIRISTAALVHGPDQTCSSPPVTAVEAKPPPSAAPHCLPSLQMRPKD